MNKGRLDSLIVEWAEDVVNTCHKSGFYGINIVEKILRDPGITRKGSRHRILWWPRNRRIAKMSRAMHQIDSISQVCLIVKYGKMVQEDGTFFTKQDLVNSGSLTLRKFNEIVKKAKTKLRDITKT